MKQITYEIRGLVLDSMVPSLTASIESLLGVRRIVFSVTEQESSARLTLMVQDLNDSAAHETLERGLMCIMTAKGLELVRPALSLREVEDVSPDPRDLPEAVVSHEKDDNADIKDKDTEEGDFPRHYVATPAPREGRKVGLTSAIASVIAAVVLAVLLTFSLTTTYMRGAPAKAETEDPLEIVDVIDRLFRSATMMELDDEALVTAVLRAYVDATGDDYAEYFTAEEYQNQLASQNGQMSGIGISVVNAIHKVGGVEYQAIVVANVYPDSPAEEAGVMPGDVIMYVGKGEDAVLVNDIGYTSALDRMTGEEGTECSFTVYRRAPGETEDTVVNITAIRRKLVTRSVIGRVYELDATVGVVRITGFDNTTREQFVEAVENLKSKGCTRFVLDLRGNPGGLLTSVEDVLVYFLEEGDTIISTKNSAGKSTVTTLQVNARGQVTCGTGTLTKEDVGRYADLDFSVLVNRYSASAAELFTANVRDHQLGTVVGVKTYGKGSMQTTFSLSRYGYSGALKLTTAHYFPPSGVGYDSIGITPDVEVALSEEAAQYNINLLPDRLDNQLAAAVGALD